MFANVLRGRCFRMGLIITVAILIGIFAVIARQVEDWKRDLRTNFAATSDDAKDPLLRPVRTSEPRPQLVELLKNSADDLVGWELKDELTATDQTTLYFVRTTPLFRFKDDIRVTVAEDASGTILYAESKSRLGRGDLGQNPRNLKELLGRFRDRLEAASSDTGAKQTRLEAS